VRDGLEGSLCGGENSKKPGTHILKAEGDSTVELLHVNPNFNDTLLKIGSGDGATVVYAIGKKALNGILSAVLALFTRLDAVLQYMGDKPNNGLWARILTIPLPASARAGSKEVVAEDAEYAVSFLREVVAVASVASATASEMKLSNEAWRELEVLREMLYPESMIRQLQSLDERMATHIQSTFEKGVQIAVALYVALSEEVAGRYTAGAVPRAAGVPPIAEEMEPIVVARMYGKLAALICHAIAQLNGHLSRHEHWNTGFKAEIVAKEFQFRVGGPSQAVDRAAMVERDMCRSVKDSLLWISEKKIEKIWHTEYSQRRKNLGGLLNGARMNAKMGKMLFKELRRLGFDVEVDTRMKLVLNRPQHEDAEESIKYCYELDLGVDEEDVVRAWIEQDVDLPMP
jgi:hypothetical protein